MTNTPRTDRPGFTVIETVIAIALLMVGAAIVAEVAAWSIIERSRMETRLAALEWTDNVLETARALAWKDLTPEWAKSQQLPPELSQLMNAPVAVVKIEIDPNRPLVKRIIAEVRWKLSDGTAAPPIALQGAFAAREGSP